MKQKLYSLLSDFLLKLGNMVVFIIIGLLVVFVLNSFIRLFYLTYAIPLYKMPIWLVIYTMFSLSALIKYGIIPGWGKEKYQMNNFEACFIIAISFVNYIVLYNFIKPENWSANNSFLGLVFKTVYG